MDLCQKIVWNEPFFPKNNPVISGVRIRHSIDRPVPTHVLEEYVTNFSITESITLSTLAEWNQERRMKRSLIKLRTHLRSITHSDMF